MFFMKMTPKNCILDTDLGRDIDDAWALTMLLKQSELDLKLITTAAGDTYERGMIARRLLAAAGRTDILVAIGSPVECGNGVLQHELVTPEAEITDFPDAVESIRSTVMQYAPEPVTLIGIAPMCNLAELAEKYPQLPAMIDLVLMAGSLGSGNTPPIAEWNVKCDIKSAQKVFNTRWRSLTVTPLESCGKVRLSGNYLQKLALHPGALERELASQYRAWLHAYNWNGVGNLDNTPIPEQQTSTLYDTVAIHLAAGGKYLQFKQMHLKIDDNGIMSETTVAPQLVNVASGWLDLAAYTQELSEMILSYSVLNNGKFL
ncbi:MAG: nucleoside hydrolase [Lentisphaerae bacterium]|nr:nucleoside hydrolase [Lentisphaerota bacterium]